MSQKGQILKQRGFVRKWMKGLKTPETPLAVQKLSEDELDYVLNQFWNDLTDELSKGHRVIFEHWITFYTKPVRRKCFNIYTKEEWITHKNRVRTNILDHFRAKSETDIDENSRP